MVGLHLEAKCLVCVEPFPAADRQEDTSAKLLGQFIPQYGMKNTPKVTPLKKIVMNSFLSKRTEMNIFIYLFIFLFFLLWFLHVVYYDFKATHLQYE